MRRADIVPAAVVGQSRLIERNWWRIDGHDWSVIVLRRITDRSQRGAQFLWIAQADGREVARGYAHSLPGSEWAAYDALFDHASRLPVVR